MKQEVEFEYFHGYEAEQFAFYRIPKLLFTDNYFRGLSSDAKILYGLMLDRMALSVKNRWIDKDDRVYIIFTLEQVMEYLNCGKDKGVKILAELDSDKGIGLIERVKRGLGKPAIIYVKSFLIKRDPESGSDAETPPSAADVIRSPEYGNAEVKTSEKPKSGVLGNRGQDFWESDLINTDYSYTDYSETNLIDPSNNPPAIKQENASDDVSKGVSGKVDRIDVIEAYTGIIKNNIEYDSLVVGCCLGDKEYIDEMVELLAEIVGIERDTINITGVEYPYQFVKGKLLKIGYSHIQYVLECLNRNTTKIHNIKAYLLTCLFNAPSTISSYYRAEVNHDMYGVP